jgi:hypothetical protein
MSEVLNQPDTKVLFVFYELYESNESQQMH